MPNLRVDALSDDEADAGPPPASTMPGQLAPVIAKQRRPFVEVFAGSCHLSQAFAAAGHATFAFDIKLDATHDLHSDQGIKLLMSKVQELEKKFGVRPYLHWAPPCSTYSQARFPKIRSSSKPNGLPSKELSAKDKRILKYANKITKNAFRTMLQLSRAGYMVSLEQPSTSLMLKVRDFKTWAHRSGAAPIIVDYCQFGMQYRKRTALWVSPAGFLDALSRKCPGNHVHASSLSGWSFNKASRVATSKGCSAYPPELCSEWVRVFEQHDG